MEVANDRDDSGVLSLFQQHKTSEENTETTGSLRRRMPIRVIAFGDLQHRSQSRVFLRFRGGCAMAVRRAYRKGP